MCLLLQALPWALGSHAESNSCRPVPRAPTFQKRCSKTTEYSRALGERKAEDGGQSGAGRDVCVFYVSNTTGSGTKSDKMAFTHRPEGVGRPAKCKGLRQEEIC